MIAFLDGSGVKASDFLVLTGVAAQDYLWDRFEPGWSEVLQNRSPIASQLHTVDLLAGAKEFSRTNSWTQEKCWALLWDCVKYAQTLDKLDFRVFTCTIDMGAYRELKAKGNRLPGYYAMCSRFSPELILKWYLEKMNINSRFSWRLSPGKPTGPNRSRPAPTPLHRSCARRGNPRPGKARRHACWLP